MAGSPLVLGRAETDKIATLRRFASANPLDVLEIREMMKTREGYNKHYRRMKRYTIVIPTAFVVTFSIETGHPAGLCRHMSMSSKKHGRTPTPEAVMMLTEALGFVGGLEGCVIWEENIGGGDVAINVVQPVALRTEASPGKAN
jgi:hypothetical protein